MKCLDFSDYKMSLDNEVDWNKFVGFCIFTFEEELIFDKVVNPKSDFSSVYHIIDTSLNTRKELQKSKQLSLANDMFRVDYRTIFNVIFAFMFKPGADDNHILTIIDRIKEIILEHLKDYGNIDTMEVNSQSALIKRLGSLISERACNQLKSEYYSSKPKLKEVSTNETSTASSSSTAFSSTRSKVTPSSATVSARAKSSQSTSSYSKPSASTKKQGQTSTTKTKLGSVETLLNTLGVKAETASGDPKKRAELAEQVLEQTKRDSIKRFLSSIIKGLDSKTGVCFVYTDASSALDVISYGMSEKHATFVLGILSKYPEIIKQLLGSKEKEKTLDAGDGVVILEDTENGILVGITKNKSEISTIAERLKMVKTLINQFLKSSF